MLNIGILIGKVSCPKCGELIVNPRVADLDDNEKPIIICKCGNWFVVDCEKLKY